MGLKSFSVHCDGVLTLSRNWNNNKTMVICRHFFFSRPVSPYLACAVDGEISPNCGYSEIDEYGCLASDCCWTESGIPAANRQEDIASTEPTTSAPTTSAESTEASIATTMAITNTSSQCSLPVGEKEMTTDDHGLVVIPIPGQGEYTITVNREGFEPLVYTFTTTLHPDTCEPITLQLAITQEIICDEGLPVHLTVLDNSTALPIPE